jgi:hypothetical protein
MKREITQVLTLIERAKSEQVSRPPVTPLNKSKRSTKSQNLKIETLYQGGVKPVDIERG